MVTGPMDRILTIQQKTVTADGQGAAVESWATLKSIWAERRELKLKERLQAEQVNLKITCSYFSQYNSDITEKMRAIEGSQTFEIIGVREIGRKQGTELICATI